MTNISIKATGEWKRMRALLQGGAKMKVAVRKSLEQEGAYLAGEVKKYMRTGAFEPLSKTTLRMRRVQGFRGTKPLIRSGDMRNSVTHVVRNNSLFVGIPRTARSRDGESLHNIAAIQENGATFAIKVTPAMRRFWFAVLFKGESSRPGSGGPAKNIIIIRIPARPFLGPVFAREAGVAPERFLNRLAKNLGIT